MNFDTQVRVTLYDHILEHGAVPSSQDVARVLSSNVQEVRAAFMRLAQGRALVLQEDGEILMANPFSAVPTAFVVEVDHRSWWGNCIWDALGIVAMLGSRGRVVTSCGCCNFRMVVGVENGALRNASGIAHFAIPARHWWDDIVFN